MRRKTIVNMEEIRNELLNNMDPSEAKAVRKLINKRESRRKEKLTS